MQHASLSISHKADGTLSGLQLTVDWGTRDEACAEHMAEMHGREPAALVAAMLRHAALQPGGGRADAEVSGAVSAAAAAEQLAQMRRRQPELPTLTVNAASRILWSAPLASLSHAAHEVSTIEIPCRTCPGTYYS